MDIQEKLMALRGRKPDILGHEACFKSAVAIPLVQHEGAWCVLFEKRSSTLDAQPGEICFPGGKIEPEDCGPSEAAIRETCEELGIDRGKIELLAPLDLLVTPFGLIIYPYLCLLQDNCDLGINPDEVETVFCVPLSYLINTEPMQRMISVKMAPPPDYPYDLIPNGRNYPWREGGYPQYFYLWEEHVIWGLTARILYHFISLLK